MASTGSPDNDSRRKVELLAEREAALLGEVASIFEDFFSYLYLYHMPYEEPSKTLLKFLRDQVEKQEMSQDEKDFYGTEEVFANPQAAKSMASLQPLIRHLSKTVVTGKTDVPVVRWMADEVERIERDPKLKEDTNTRLK
eukprot:CAMPEP_0172584908 /NCGR_PEP_ID=MMETSP1068-20121228/4449_1 /TAXON_ID=35684 /ORGANISM="Pseudopedinella elastica, Strain CCMP716" /LENGTH=139 /DNA_ID=CAMNT_0013379223 /DNA_START=75 /DNA_END=494 /DNA_ORIENTATION=-